MAAHNRLAWLLEARSEKDGLLDGAKFRAEFEHGSDELYELCHAVMAQCSVILVHKVSKSSGRRSSTSRFPNTFTIKSVASRFSLNERSVSLPASTLFLARQEPIGIIQKDAGRRHRKPSYEERAQLANHESRLGSKR